MAIKKILLGVLTFFFINLSMSAQTEFKVQGKLVRNGSGFKEIGMRIFSLEKDKIKHDLSIKNTKTD